MERGYAIGGDIQHLFLLWRGYAIGGDIQHLFLLWRGGMQLLVMSNICFYYGEGVCNCW